MAELQQERYHESCRRNGWTLPLHFLQVFAWIVVTFFIIVYFTTLVPVLAQEWQPAGYIINGIVCAIHLVCHIVAATINPGDVAVLQKRFQSTVVHLDRAKHRHVIENQHCYLCEVNVGPKSKHCSACNKCVSDFDHHCKWLNNCIGGRNYRWFIVTLISALVSIIVCLCICFAQFIGYFTDKNNGDILQPYKEHLSTSTGNKTGDAVFTIMYQPVPDWAWLLLISFTGLLTIASIGLLIHLLSFHAYLTYHQMSTYDFIIKQRDIVQLNDEQPTYEDSRTAKCKKKINRIMPSKKSSDPENGIPRSEKLMSRGQCMKNNSSQVESYADGETPPPSSSPLLRNKNMSAITSTAAITSTDSPTVVKKMKKKKKAKLPTLAVDDANQNDAKHNKKSNSHHSDYHSDSAESISEVNPNKTADVCSEDSAVVTGNHYSSQASLISSIAKQAKKKKKPKNTSSDANSELNSTMIFTVNDSAKLNLDGSLDYSDGFKSLPLTPVMLRKRANEVPPLDFGGLRSSTESTNTYMPYTGTVRSTDTVLFSSDRPLPSLKSVPESRLDTEV